MGAGGLADHVQLALQRVLHDDVVATTDEDLAQHRLLFAHGGRHRHLAVDRHIAPAQQHLAFGLDGALQLLLAGQAGGVLLGQEDHAHAVFAGRRQHHALLGHFLAIQRVGNLDQDTGAVPHELVSTHCAAVIQVFEDLERALNDLVGLVTLDMRHKTHTAGVVFVGTAIQTVVLQMLDLGSRGHGALLKISQGPLG
jgi:hypothetical protein